MLVEKSQEELIQYMTPKDAEEYFTDTDAGEKWYFETAKEPLILWLGTLAGDLAGMAYITNCKDKYIDQSGLCIAGIRIYDGYRDKGYGTELSRELHNIYDEVPRKSTQFSMQIDNNAAFALGIKFGYRLKNEGIGGQTLVRKPPTLL